METQTLELACRASGMLESAIEDGLARLRSHFSAQADPTPQLVSAQLQRLRTEAAHLFPREGTVSESGTPIGVPEAVWKGLSPASKLAYAREHGYGLPPVERRAKPLTLTSEQTAALAKLPPAARLDAFRELQRQTQSQG